MGYCLLSKKEINDILFELWAIEYFWKIFKKNSLKRVHYFLNDKNNTHF